MEQRIKDRLFYLYVMLNNYSELNSKTKHKYDWRSVAITNQIDSLERILDDLPNDDWNECFKEDLHHENLD